MSGSSNLATNISSNLSSNAPVGHTAGQMHGGQNGGGERKPQLEPSGAQAIEELLWEEMRLKFEFEELLNLKVLKFIFFLHFFSFKIYFKMLYFACSFQIFR